MTRMKWLISACALIVALAGACSDDSTSESDNGVPHDGSSTVKDGASTINDSSVGDSAEPWPDMTAYNDSTAWSCTAGQQGMCDDNKLFYCLDGKCAACPTNYVDCDRSGDCECLGACDGTKCVSPNQH